MMMEPLQTYALTGAPLNDITILVDIDVGGHFILPGLIDVHAHIVGVGSPELLDNRPLYQYFFPFHSVKGSPVCLKI